MTRSGAPTWNRRAVVRRARMRAESRHRAARAKPSAVTVACASTVAITKRRSRGMDAERLGVTPLSFDPVVETRSSESPRARPRVVASGSHGTVICDHHERAGGCVGGIVPREQRLATRSAALGASGGWCRATPTILRRLRLGPTAVNLVHTRSGDVVAHVQEAPASRKSQDRAARRRCQCPKARPSPGSKRSAEH